MNFKISFIPILFFSTILFAQEHTDIFEFETSVTGDFAYNFKGGIKQGYTYIGMEQLSLSLSTDSAKLWKGGTFFVHGMNAHGLGPTAKFVGDMQCLSNIEAGDFTSLYEFWYMQQIGNFSILLGQHDLNTEFVGSHYGENFINSSFGIIPSISLNVPVSIYPVTSPCFLIKFSPDDDLIFKLASYYGNPGSIDDNRFNIQWHFDKKEGFMNIFEIEFSQIMHIQHGIYTSKGIKMGTYKLGAYYHSGYFINPVDSLAGKNGNYGFYILADQMIVPKPSNPDEGLAAMLQFGIAPSNLNLIKWYYGAGIRYHGILPKRTKDFIGLSVAGAILNDNVTGAFKDRLKQETAIELSYKFEFRNHYSIQPDFQYIINPGASKFIKNALVGLIRFQLSY
jgi:porin